MRRWTSATSSNAASMTRCASRVLLWVAEISTKVPRSGRHRRTSAREDERMKAQEAPDTFGDVTAGEGGAADVLDVDVELQRRAVGLADELLAPLRVADLVSVGLAIVEDLDLPHGAVGVQGKPPGDELMLADHLVPDEPAQERGALACAPDLLGCLVHVDARVLLDGAYLFAGQLHVG